MTNANIHKHKKLTLIALTGLEPAIVDPRLRPYGHRDRQTYLLLNINLVIRFCISFKHDARDFPNGQFPLHFARPVIEKQQYISHVIGLCIASCTVHKPGFTHSPFQPPNSLPPPFYPPSMKLCFRNKTLSPFRGRCDVTVIIGIQIRFTHLTFYRVFAVSIIFAGN